MEQVSENSTMVELLLGKEHITNNEYYLKLVSGGNYENQELDIERIFKILNTFQPKFYLLCL